MRCRFFLFCAAEARSDCRFLAPCYTMARWTESKVCSSMIGSPGGVGLKSQKSQINAKAPNICINRSETGLQRIDRWKVRSTFSNFETQNDVINQNEHYFHFLYAYKDIVKPSGCRRGKFKRLDTVRLVSFMLFESSFDSLAIRIFHIQYLYYFYNSLRKVASFLFKTFFNLFMSKKLIQS